MKTGELMGLKEYKTTTVRTFELAESACALNIHAEEGWNIHATVPDWDIKDRIIVIWEREATTPEVQGTPAISPREAYRRYVQKRDMTGLDSCEDQSSGEGNKKNKKRYWNERD